MTKDEMTKEDQEIYSALDFMTSKYLQDGTGFLMAQIIAISKVLIHRGVFTTGSFMKFLESADKEALKDITTPIREDSKNA